MNPLRKAAPLQPGATIALVAPSGPSPPDQINRAITYLEQRGYKVAPGKNLYRTQHYLAGSDTQRADDLMEAFTAAEVSAVLCTRGGYGSTRLLDQLDYPQIQTKFLLGFSDTTGLHLALYARLGLVGFTGALAAFDLGREDRDNFTEDSLWRTLVDPAPLGRLPLDEKTCAVLRPGRATGPLVGGNLALLCSLLGTPYMPPLERALLFFGGCRRSALPTRPHVKPAAPGWRFQPDQRLSPGPFHRLLHRRFPFLSPNHRRPSQPYRYTHSLRSTLRPRPPTPGPAHRRRSQPRHQYPRTFPYRISPGN